MRDIYFTDEVWTIWKNMTLEDQLIGCVKNERIEYMLTSADLSVWFDARISLKRRLKLRKDAGGAVAIEVWQRDCDMVEFTRLVYIDATTEAYEKLEDTVAKNAEGPYCLRILTPTEAATFKPESRDRALEAFEDGHPHIIYGERA